MYKIARSSNETKSEKQLDLEAKLEFTREEFDSLVHQYQEANIYSSQWKIVNLAIYLFQFEACDAFMGSWNDQFARYQEF